MGININQDLKAPWLLNPGQNREIRRDQEADQDLETDQVQAWGQDREVYRGAGHLPAPLLDQDLPVDLSVDQDQDLRPSQDRNQEYSRVIILLLIPFTLIYVMENYLIMKNFQIIKNIEGAWFFSR